MKKVTKNNEKDGFSELFGKNEFSVRNDAFDRADFNEIKEHSSKLLKTEEEMLKEYEQFTQLQQDLFSALFKNAVELEDDFKLNKEFLLNKELMKMVIEMPKYKELRIFTRLDKINSTIGTESISEEVKELIRQLKEQFKEHLKAIGDAADEVDAAEEESEDENENENESQNGGRKSPKMTIEEAKAKLEEARANFKESMGKKEIKNSLEKIVSKVRDRVKESSDFIQNWGLDASTSFQKKSYHEKMELIDRLKNNSKMQHIAKLAGRLKVLMLQRQHERVKKGVDEIHTIVQGQDLSRMLPSELAKLQDPLTEKLFMSDFIEGKTLQYELHGKEKKCKGAIVCCIDDSGSMDGMPEIWAKAVALTLLDIAKLQKRDFYCIHFDASPKKDLHTNTFLKTDYGDIEEVIDMAEYFTGGGTLFEPPLELAQDKIMLDQNFSKADIIFITDGESVVGDKWLKEYLNWKKNNKVSIFSILIDSYANNPVVLNTFSDEVRKVSDIRDSGEDVAINIIDNLL
jgi:uncharacterized protein with von Willebrand factor type A (vWA) domain